MCLCKFKSDKTKEKNDIENNKQTSDIESKLSPELKNTLFTDDYNRVLSNYEKIYDRTGIILGICGVILPYLIDKTDFSIIFKFLSRTRISWINYSYSLITTVSTILCCLVIWKSFRLLRSRSVYSFDSKYVKDIADKNAQDAISDISDRYITVIKDIRDTTGEKQAEFNEAIKLLILSIMFFVFSQIIMKGGLL